MTLNGVIALILRYFAEFHGFAGHLRYSSLRMKIDLCSQNIVSQLHLAKTDLRSSRKVSLRQLSFLVSVKETGSTMNETMSRANSPRTLYTQISTITAKTTIVVGVVAALLWPDPDRSDPTHGRADVCAGGSSLCPTSMRPNWIKERRDHRRRLDV